ncbi:MAG: triose-phosphate isomerase [Bdellovibrionota bacterium]|nr:triose-phosphate isomerase [Bdellovibrionota bacterium]
MSGGRDVYIVGNWKMNQSLEEIDSFLNQISTLNSNNHAWIAPQALHISKCLEKKPGFLKVGSQNCAHEDSGAFTGELSPKSLKEIGVHFTLIGHSERRSLYGEGDDLLYKKTLKALENNLYVIFCIGETLEEREAGKVEEVLSEQLSNGLRDIDSKNVLIAYEPVWAIGTGVTASPEQAGEAHKFIRNYIKENMKLDAQTTPILYGGSVKPENIKELLSNEDIDGGLVGGASLKADSYINLHKNA